jgi:hypothetical protein
MPIAADYARVVEAMRQPLPAYVSYLQRERVGGMANTDSQSRIVVRTSDHKVVHGSKSTAGGVERPVFDPACYRPTGEKTVDRGGQTAVSFSLAPLCGTSEKSPFTALVVEPSTMRPLEAAGRNEHDHAAVNVIETFTTVRGYSVPASLKVDVEGNGLAAWLQVHVTETFSDYAFHSADPG